MSTRIEKIEAEAKRLSPRERADLAQRLFASVEEDEISEADLEVEAEWLAEAERRYARHLAGETTASPAAEVLERIRTRLGGS